MINPPSGSFSLRIRHTFDRKQKKITKKIFLYSNIKFFDIMFLYYAMSFGKRFFFCIVTVSRMRP